MFKPAFSTVACPELTLEEAAQAADRFGFDGIELRTFDDGPARIACEPALTAPEKVRRIFGSEGVTIVGLGTSTRFDDPLAGPPGLNFVFGDNEKGVREAKRHIEVASAIGAPLVRVFAFQSESGESRKRLLRRVVSRLKLAADGARHSGVRLAVENGGDFPLAEDLAEIVEAVGSPLLGACYSIGMTVETKEDVRRAVKTLGDDLLMVRMKDFQGRRPCLLGQGELACRELVDALVERGFAGPVVYEWDRLWVKDLASADEALPHAARMLYGWMAEEQREALSAAAS
ncbi:MAG: sugar phosphate isomerase/epimerase [Planctomycetota bacterium]|nr:sugar phosphate isomerase/epimerase [Planctomycetota bacterium]